MSDLIDRQAAIDYLTINMNWYDEDGCETDESEKISAISDLINGVPPVQQKEYTEEDVRGAFNDGYSIGRNMDGWIPCAEQLPDEPGLYLVTIKHQRKQPRIALRIMPEKCNRWKDPRSGIVAWMHLPEVYKGE